MAVPCCDPSCREMLFLSLCVGCLRPHTVLCVLGKHSGGHAPPAVLLSSLFPFYLTPLLQSTVSCLTPFLPVTLPLLLNPFPSCRSPPHINPFTTHFSSYPFLSLHPPLSLLSYPVGPSLSAGNSVWNRPVCGAGCLLCASHPLRTVSWPPLISGDHSALSAFLYRS